jgi:thioredoxin-like negative regulator of GroEL
VWRAIAAVALLAACRGDRPAPAAHRDASVVPHLPASEDPAAVMRRIDATPELYRARNQDGFTIPALLERAAVRGRLEDYQDALALSARWVEAEPKQELAWRLRVQALSRVHRFADARAALEGLKARSTEWQDLEATIDEASGHLERSGPVREATARTWRSPTNLVAWAASLALEGKLDDALAVMPKAAAAVHDNSPTLLEYILFQWGRLYEQKGEMAAARELFAAARARLPTLEATTHLAQTMIATGDSAGAKKLVDGALAADRHPELLALAAQLGAPLVDEARREWERYVAALPEAFSDHAARFYLGPGADPSRALALARVNLANRDTREARALVVEAALAAHDATAACEVVEPIVGPPALRAQRFIAWRALAACGRNAEADRLATELGIAR